MAYKKILVDIPTERVSFKKAPNGARYVYYHLRYYRNDKGTPTRKEVSIGKTSTEQEGKMYPNETYFEYFESAPNVSVQEIPNGILQAGSTAFLAHLAEDLDLSQILESVFGSLTSQILSLANYMISQGNVMMYLENFYQTHYNPYDTSLSSRHLSEIYDQITPEKRDEFFTLWQEHLQVDGDYVAYDVTSISTHAKDIPMAEKGYNRDGERLPQLNVGMFYSQTQTLPLGYVIYHGSIVDKSYFANLVQYATHLGLERVIFVLDRGFLTKEHLQETLKDLNYILAFPSSQKTYSDFLLEHAPSIKNLDNYSFDVDVYCGQSPIMIEDTVLTGFAYYDSSKSADGEQAIYQAIREKKETYQSQLDRKKRKQTDPYYDLQVEGGALTNYTLNNQRVQEKLDLAGMFGLVTNIVDIPADEALKIYRRRDTIEKAFDSLKNDLDFGRFKTHSTQSTQGKFFIGFIALILQAEIQRKSTHELRKKVPTIKSLILELDKIQRVIWNDQATLFAPLTKKQKDILGHFEIDPDVFEEKIVKN